MHYALVPVGIAGILVSLVHGYLGQTQLIARADERFDSHLERRKG